MASLYRQYGVTVQRLLEHLSPTMNHARARDGAVFWSRHARRSGNPDDATPRHLSTSRRVTQQHLSTSGELATRHRYAWRSSSTSDLITSDLITSDLITSGELAMSPAQMSVSSGRGGSARSHA